MRASNRPFAISNSKSSLPISGFMIGMGAKAAQARLHVFQSWLAQNKVKPLIFHFGFSGATVEQWPAGTLFVPHYFETQWNQFPLHNRESLKLRLLKCIQVDRVINADSERAEIFKKTGAAAVDMESYTVQQWSQARGFPALSVRVIFDTPRHELGPFHKLVDDEGRLKPLSLIREYGRHPGQLLALKRHAQMCREKLNSIAQRLLDGLYSE